MYFSEFPEATDSKQNMCPATRDSLITNRWKTRNDAHQQMEGTVWFPFCDPLGQLLPVFLVSTYVVSLQNKLLGSSGKGHPTNSRGCFLVLQNQQLSQVFGGLLLTRIHGADGEVTLEQ